MKEEEGWVFDDNKLWVGFGWCVWWMEEGGGGRNAEATHVCPKIFGEIN